MAPARHARNLKARPAVGNDCLGDGMELQSLRVTAGVFAV
jgi:hypothetical protein